jgi:rhodanese-related sulfurtransferase
MSRKIAGPPDRQDKRPQPDAANPAPGPVTDRRAAVVFLAVVMILAAIVVIGADAFFGAVASGGGSPSPQAATASATIGADVIVAGKGGYWTNVSPDRLAQMLEHKDFTLVNVKTPYSGEIAGTDLYIPYDQLTARASELPADKGARILVYCRSGAQSVQAAQTLLDLGYTNIWNLDGGMNAWEASGRQLVNMNRQ